jgi:Fe2+ transport system protein FeoA
VSAAACPLCGHRFEPESHGGCASCPVGSGCGTLCCPACGYTTIDASRSALVRLWRRLRGRRPAAAPAPATLRDAKPGATVRIAGFADPLPSRQREHLAAYGLVAGRTVRVLQHSPATVVQIEHLELALEGEIAARVKVEPAAA